MTDPGSDVRVPITYATHSASQATAQLAHIVPLLAEQFPLRNLHWRPPVTMQTLRPLKRSNGSSGMDSVPALRTIQNLNVELIPLATHLPNQQNVQILERVPCVHIFFVTCDDIDVYRAQVRNEIRHWLATLRKHIPNDFDHLSTIRSDEQDKAGTALPPEHLIVLLPPPSSGVFTASSATSSGKSAMGRFYTMNKGTVLEKLRADFNSSAKEHVLALSKLPTSSKDNDPALWIDIIAHIKTCTLASLGRVLGMQDRVVSMYDESTKGVNWTLSGSITRKEFVIQTLEGLGLLHDVLHIYDTVETHLERCIADGRTPFVPGGNEPGDDSLMLLGPLRKPYLSLMASNRLSLFDIQCYLYARRSTVHAALGEVVQVMQMTPAFIASVTRMLRPHRHLLAQAFLEAWSFSVTLDAVEQCQAWLVEAQGETDDVKTTHAFHAAKAELLELAVRQLISIGLQSGHLPRVEPFQFVASDSLSMFAPDARITRKELVEAMAHRHVFESQLCNVIHRTLLAAVLCQQTPRTLRLKYILACFHMSRSSFHHAHALWDELLAHPALPYSAVLYGPTHSQYLACLQAEHLAHGDVWIQALVAAIQAISTLRAQPLSPQPMDEMSLLTWLADESDNQHTYATLVGYNGCRVHVRSIRADRDGAHTFLDIDLFSYLPKPLSVDAVHIWVANYRQVQLQFSASAHTLEPGLNRLRLVCMTSAVGYFHLQATQIQFRRVLLESIVQSAASLSTLADAQQLEYRRHRICIPADGAALQMHVSMPRVMSLQDARSVELHLDSGRDPLEEATISVLAHGDVRLKLDEDPCLACDNRETSVSRTESGSLLLRHLPARTSCTMALPVSYVPRTPYIELSIVVYFQRNGYDCSVHRTLRAPFHLPFSINIQDFFRLHHLLSKLSLETTAGTHVRVCTPQVTASEEGPVSIQVPVQSVPLRMRPREASTFLLQFQYKYLGTRRAANPPFALSIVYRTAADEAQGLALYYLSLLLAQTPSWMDGDQQLLQRALCECLEHATFDVGSTPMYEAKYWHDTLFRWGWPQESQRSIQVLELVRGVFARLEDPSMDAMLIPTTAPSHVQQNAAQQHAWEASQKCLQWRTLTLPLDVPFVDAVNSVSILAPERSHISLGEPIDITIDVTISLVWSQASDDDVSTVLQYNILTDFDHWLVWGNKKGMWEIPAQQLESHHTIHTTLLPVRTGWLLYPRIRITPIGPAARPFRCETYMRQADQGIYVVSSSHPDTYWVDLRPVEIAAH